MIEWRWKQPTSSRYSFWETKRLDLRRNQAFHHASGGDKRDRTADLLNAICSASITRRHLRLNKSTWKTTKNPAKSMVLRSSYRKTQRHQITDVFTENRKSVRRVLEDPLLQKKKNGIYEISFGGKYEYKQVLFRT